MNIGSINLNLLVALEALLSERSVTRAARRTGVTQSTMSYSLARLREVFEDPLLVRGPEGLVPTRLAESLVGPLRRGLRELEHVLEAREVFDPATSQRRFRLVASDYLQVVGLHELLGRLADRAPGVELIVKPTTAGTLEALSEGRIDLVCGERPPGRGLSRLKLFTESFVCLLSKGHRRRKLSLKAYCDAAHVLVARGEGPGYVDEVLSAMGRSRRVVCRIPDYAGVGHVVASTELVGTVPRRLALRLAESLPLVVAEVPFPLEAFDLFAFWHPRYEAEPGGRWLREVLLESGPTNN